MSQPNLVTRIKVVTICLFTVPALSQATYAQWTLQASNTKARLRGLSVVNDKIAWASGTQGTYVRTTDGGTTWMAGIVAGASESDFRDIHALDDRRAYLLAIGEGTKSRIYRTIDAGESWTLQFMNQEPKGFLDALAFWDADHGIALGDPVDRRFTILTTDNGGATWTKSPSDKMPAALKGEGAFAASGTCLVVHGDRRAWFATGGADVSRVFRSDDLGQSWEAHETPVQAGNSTSGIFSLAFSSENRGVAIGGDYKHPEQTAENVAWTSDGGRNWTLPRAEGPAGYRSGVAMVPGTTRPTLVAVGPTGSDFSTDGGQSWLPLGKMGFHAVAFASADAGWAVGEDGAIARFNKTLESPR
jgi:photosystem II stability/assembly factor-like uncharacterized protein